MFYAKSEGRVGDEGTIYQHSLGLVDLLQTLGCSLPNEDSRGFTKGYPLPICSFFSLRRHPKVLARVFSAKSKGKGKDEGQRGPFTNMFL